MASILPQVEADERTSLQRILDVAEQQFAERGYDGVSINEVAAAAGVCKANVFHHCASKQELYERVRTRACEAFMLALDELELAGDGFAARVTQLIAWHEAFLRRRPWGTRLILRELAEDREEQGPVFPLIRRNFERVVGVLAEVGDELRDGISPALIAKVVLSLNLFAFQTERLTGRLVALGSLEEQDAMRAQLIDLLLRGALKDRAST